MSNQCLTIEFQSAALPGVKLLYEYNDGMGYMSAVKGE